MYQKVSTSLNFVEREKETLAFWKENKIFEKSVELRRGAEPYTFYDGPPTANGKPHIGHILTRAIKDIIPRYRTMKGYDVLRKAGWDTHGLPVELEVEKLLGLDGKEQIEQYGVEPFIQKCKESVWKYKAEWEQMSDRVGFWADMDAPYVTYEDNYIESEWWALKKIHEKGLLYKGHKIVPYCPRCGTALASHEVAQGYKDVKETSATVRFRCKDEDASYLAWTTTPWTLPSNVCLCVNANVAYCRAEKDGEAFILAKELVPSVLGEEGVTIVREFPGSELVGRAYEPLFPCTAKACGGKRAHYVVADDYVTTTDGTGIVHNAPAFGVDDQRVCAENGLPFIQLVNTRGEMCGGTPWDGVFVKKADPMILDALRESGLLFAAPQFEHSYPFCWRCDTPLIYYARESWFIRMTAIKDRLIEYNRRINWLPETIKEGRMGNFLENVVDWGLSRERYWGKGMTADKEAAFMTLFTVLKTMALLSAPFTPFMAEEIYQNLVRSVDASAPESVHLCDFPAADEGMIDPALEAHMAEALSIVVLGRAARNAANVKNRQPLSTMYVQGAELPAMFVSIIADELNVKQVEFVADASAFISYKVKPQLKTLGPRYGKVLPKINAYLQGEGVGDLVVAAHKAGKNYEFELDGVAVSLAEADVLTEPMQKAGFVSQTEHDLSVVLDTNLTDALIEEGFVRELVSKVQTMRKEAGFEVTDHIALTYAGSPRIAEIFASHGADIASDTLADSIAAGEAKGYAKEWDVNGEHVALGVERL